MNISGDTQKLINYSIDFAEKMLNYHQAFYHFASTINQNGELIATAVWDGDDHPQSIIVIDKLDSTLEKQIELKEKRAYALVYDVTVRKDNSTEKLDAIKIKLRHTESVDTTIYYFTYKLNSQNMVEHLDSWAEVL